MSYSNGKITAPVSVNDVQHVTGNSSTDLGTLCKGPNIKMWAKYKPVIFGSLDTLAALNSQIKQWNPNASAANQWWKATNGDYGLTYSTAMVSVSAATTTAMKNALSSLALLVNGNANGWGYAKPAGGLASPYRLTDFLEYNHNVSNPVAGSATSDVVAGRTTGYTVGMGIIRTEPTSIESRDYLVQEDITNYSLNLGFAIFKLAGSTMTPIAWCTGTMWDGAGIFNYDESDGIVADSGSWVETHLKNGGTYYVLPFYCTETLAQPTVQGDHENYSAAPSVSTAKLFTVPYTNFASFSATQRSSAQSIGKPVIGDMVIANDWTYSTDFFIDSTFAGYSGGTATNVIFAVVNNLWQGTFDAGTYAYYHDFGSVVVGANETKLIGVPAVSGTLDSTKMWRVVIRFTPLGGSMDETIFQLIQPVS